MACVQEQPAGSVLRPGAGESTGSASASAVRIARRAQAKIERGNAAEQRAVSQASDWRHVQVPCLAQAEPSHDGRQEDIHHVASSGVTIGHLLGAVPQGQTVGSKKHEMGGAQREPRHQALPDAHLQASKGKPSAGLRPAQQAHHGEPRQPLPTLRGWASAAW